MDAILQALAAPTRRQVLTLIRDRELSAGEIAARFEVTRPAISQHLTVLRHAGLIDVRPVGTRRLYRARPDALRELRGWLEAFWPDRHST